MLTLKSGSGDMKALVAEMIRLENETVSDEEFLLFARDIVSQSAWEKHDQVKVVLEYVRDNVKYQSDPVGAELLTSPHRMMILVQQGIATGDCDCMALFCNSILRALGYDAHIVFLDQQGDGFNHAAVEVYSDVIMQYLYVDPTIPGGPAIFSVGTSSKGNPLAGEPSYRIKLEVP